MSRLRKVEVDAATLDFIGGAKTAPLQPSEVKTAPAQGRVALPVLPELPPGLSDRVPRQVNISMPETDHYQLRGLVAQMPSMSMQKFILEAIAEKIARVTRSNGDVSVTVGPKPGTVQE